MLSQLSYVPMISILQLFSYCRKRFGGLRTHILQLLWRSILLSYKSLGCHHMRPTYDWFLLLQIIKLFATRTPPTGADPAISTVTGWRLCCLSSKAHWLFTYIIRLTFWKPRQLFATFFHKMILSLLYTIISRQGRDRTYDVSDVADTTCMSAAFASRLPTENACTWTRTKNYFRLRGGCHTIRRHKHK